MSAKINGFEQMKCFFEWIIQNQDKRPSQSHISLYMFFLNENNKRGWVEWFKCPFQSAMDGAAIGSKGTYYKTLKDLQGWGLIKYKEGKNLLHPPIINLVQLSKNGHLSEQLTEHLTEQLDEQHGGLLTGKKYKLLTIKQETSKQSQFELFWSKYPIKVAKSKCKDKFNKLSNDDIETIISTIDSYVAYKPFESYRHPNPETYLNQKRWEDELKAEETQDHDSQVPQDSTEIKAMKARMRKLAGYDF